MLRILNVVRTVKVREDYVSEKLVDAIGQLNEEQKALIAQWARSIESTKEFSLAQAIQWRTKNAGSNSRAHGYTAAGKKSNGIACQPRST